MVRCLERHVAVLPTPRPRLRRRCDATYATRPRGNKLLFLDCTSAHAGDGTIPMGLDRTRGRGSTSDMGAMIAQAQQGDALSPGAEEEGDATTTPMMRDSSRGRGSVILVGEELERVKAAMAKVAKEKPTPDKTSAVKVVTNV